jgi:hypothetical protein
MQYLMVETFLCGPCRNSSQVSVAVVRSKKLVAETGGKFWSPEEGEHPPLETATNQRLVKTGKTLCVL